LAAGLLEEAAAEYDATFELAKKHELIIEDYINAAVVRRRLNDIGKSIDLLLAARRKFGDLPQIEYHLGIAYAEGGELENAAGAFRRATELKPDLDIAWRNLGRAQLELGRYGEAVAAYERAFATLEPSLKERLDLGRAYKGAGDTARARREYEVVMESDPEGKMGKRASAEIARLDSQSK
jgi:tetratricopeptide (TPR) repeat protein